MIAADRGALTAKLAADTRSYLDESTDREARGRDLCETLSWLLQKLLEGNGRWWSSGELWAAKYTWIDGISAMELSAVGDEVHIVGGAFVDAIALAPVRAVIHLDNSGDRIWAYSILFGHRHVSPLPCPASVFDLSIPKQQEDWAYVFSHEAEPDGGAGAAQQ